MKKTIEFPAPVRENVSQRRADFYLALPNRTEMGLVNEDDAFHREDQELGYEPPSTRSLVVILICCAGLIASLLLR